jgi:excinuclease ABC subunit C
VNIKEKISSLPDAPGVYFFIDAAGRILYIGKAKSLRNRVQSYFSRFLSAKIQAMTGKIADVEYRLTPSESQAQLLEASLIKEKQPPYNTDLKDDKSFPFIRISADEFPLICITRRKKLEADDKSVYYGPYIDAALLREALKVIRRIFPFRTCRTLPGKRCLFGRISLCPVPCEGRLSAAEYGETVRNIRMFLESKYQSLLDKLAEQMKDAARNQNYETAARLRNNIAALTGITRERSFPGGITASEELQNLFKLPRVPERIEAFDISNISGQEACGSMVSFHRGLPDKNNYRRFRIKTVEGIDDYKMLAEVVRRRYRRLQAENKPMPDLILIDGGKAHLQTAAAVLKSLNVAVPLISIAKDRENIYQQGKRDPTRFQGDTPALNLIRRIRDEAHRFAVGYHHVLRRKRVLGK